jgi:hypothetical protein
MLSEQQLSTIAQRLLLEDALESPYVLLEGTKASGGLSLGHLPDVDTQVALYYTGIFAGGVERQKLGELQRMTVMSEAWLAPPHGLSPSQHPERQEVLIISTYQPDKVGEKIAVQLYRLEREDEGNIRLRLVPTDGLHVESRLVEAFIEGYTQGERKAEKDKDWER